MTAVFKAQDTRPDKPVPDLNLNAMQPFPDYDDPKEAAEAHNDCAQFIVSALLASLPGGTVDAVLRLLLTHRASLLKVRWPA